MKKLVWKRWGDPEFFSSIHDIPFSDGVYVYKNDSGLILPLKLTNTHLINTSKRILVVLNAAVAQEKASPPFFSGIRLAAGFEGPVLSISDPGTHVNNVNLAWYAGTESYSNLQNHLCDLIHHLSEKTSLKPLILGSSGGGFAALVIAKLSQSQCDCIVINPQTNIFRYWKNHVATYLSECHGLEYSKTSEQILNKKGIITDVTKNPIVENPVLYLQNLFDSHHIDNHATPIFGNDFLSNSVFGIRHSITWFSAPWGRGHHRVWPDQLQLILNMCVSGFTFAEIIHKLESMFYPELESLSEIKDSTDITSYEHNKHFPSYIFDISYDDSNLSWSELFRFTIPKKINQNFYRLLYFLLDWNLWYEKQKNNPKMVISKKEKVERLKLIEVVIFKCEQLDMFDSELLTLRTIKRILNQDSLGFSEDF
jgi:hypothetical protein